jgi:hypothetical protein
VITRCLLCNSEVELKEVTMIAVDENGNDLPEDDPCYATTLIAICCTECDWFTCPDWGKES